MQKTKCPRDARKSSTNYFLIVETNLPIKWPRIGREDPLPFLFLSFFSFFFFIFQCLIYLFNLFTRIYRIRQLTSRLLFIQADYSCIYIYIQCIAPSFSVEISCSRDEEIKGHEKSSSIPLLLAALLLNCVNYRNF